MIQLDYEVLPLKKLGTAYLCKLQRNLGDCLLSLSCCFYTQVSLFLVRFMDGMMSAINKPRQINLLQPTKSLFLFFIGQPLVFCLKSVDFPFDIADYFLEFPVSVVKGYAFCEMAVISSKSRLSLAILALQLCFSSI